MMVSPNTHMRCKDGSIWGNSDVFSSERLSHDNTHMTDYTQAYPAETIVTFLREGDKATLKPYLPRCLSCAKKGIESNIDRPTKLRTEVLEASLNVVCSVLDVSNTEYLFKEAPWVMECTLSLLSHEGMM